MGNDITKSENEGNVPFIPNTFFQQTEIILPSRKKSVHGCHSSSGQEEELTNFIQLCDDFENALRTIRIHKRRKNLVHRRLLNIQKVLVEKISTLEKFNDNKFKKTNKKKEHSSNLSSQNKSLSSSTSHLHSKESSKKLVNSPLSKEFLNRVNCPFCHERQPDKYYLIKHLDESCLPFKMKNFKKEINLPYSFFQILPNNNFKCNICPNAIARDLQGYLHHFNCSSHVENFKTKSSSRTYTDSLFCSICKVLVPNNCTELIIHLRHKFHKKRSNKFITEKIFQEKKISCIYWKSEEYYCFVCSKKFFKRNNLQELIEHLQRVEHQQNLEKHGIEATKAYCESCEKELNMFEIWDHFRSLEHESKILEQKCTQYYNLCVYCSSDFSDLTELSNHMKSGCKEIEALREEGLTPGPEAASGKSTEIGKGVGGKPEVKEGCNLFIDVSDDLDVSELKNYFENFGRVIYFNKLIGNKFMIVFQERHVVNKILGCKNTIGFNSKILTVGESLSEIMENQSSEKESECKSSEENDTSDDDNSSYDEEEMKNLFQEVGSHLLKKTETMDSSEDNEILLIAQMTLKGTVTFSGFRGCQLFLPNETRLSLYCQTPNSSLDGSEIYQQEKNVKNNSTASVSMSQSMLEVIKSPFWEHAECVPGPIPYLKCVHKRSGKLCIISFSTPDRVITDALRACVEENDFVRPFLLTLKLWLSSQETFLSGVDYPVIAIVLFFLMSKSLVRPFPVTEFPIHLKIRRALTDDLNLTTKPDKNIAKEGISELFRMFLEFLKNFDFINYAVCFPIPRPVPREILTNLLGFKDNSSICIMNAWCQCNYTQNVSKAGSKLFFQLVNKTFKEI